MRKKTKGSFSEWRGRRPEDGAAAGQERAHGMWWNRRGSWPFEEEEEEEEQRKSQQGKSGSL